MISCKMVYNIKSKETLKRSFEHERVVVYCEWMNKKNYQGLKYLLMRTNYIELRMYFAVIICIVRGVSLKSECTLDNKRLYSRVK